MNKIKNIASLFLSLGLHFLVLYYPVRFVISEKIIQNEEVIVEKKEPIVIQLTELNPNTKFLRMNEPINKQDFINNSNVLSNTNNISENLVVGDSNTQNEQHMQEQEDDSLGIIKNKQNDGQVTDISAVKFKYFDYYTSVKDDIESVWKEKVNEYFSEIKLDNEIILKTILILKVNKNGIIENISIGESSGSEEVDKIAISIFKNHSIKIPPIEIFNNKDFLYLYWGFALKI